LLTVLKGILGLDLPDGVKEALKYKDLGVIEKYLLRLRIRGANLPEYYVPLCFFAINGLRGKMAFLYESMFPRDEIMAQIYLMSPSRSRFYQVINRMVRTLSLVGNGIRQAVQNRSFGN
jgi:hypothetical protein